MQVFKQFHKIILDIFNHMLPTIYTVKSLEPVLNCTELDCCTLGWIDGLWAGLLDSGLDCWTLGWIDGL